VLLHPAAYNAFLDIAITDKGKRAEARKIWDGLASFYSELIKPLNNPEERTERLAKSITVQDKAVMFVESYTAQLGADMATLYMHQAINHVPEIVLRFDLNILNMSQQYLEAKLKEGKTNMQLFTNRRLTDDRQEKGRNYQVMAKGRERIALRQKVHMPMSRNKRRQLGDGSKAAEQTVERARRRGQLVSRSQLQIETKLANLAPEIGRVYLAYKEKVDQLTPVDEEGESEGDAPAAGPSALPSMASNVEGENPLPAAAPALTAGRGVGRGAARGGAGAARGWGSSAGPPAGRGLRGRGAGRGRGMTAGGRAIPASARMI
jgi:hypothetical protein